MNFWINWGFFVGEVREENFIVLCQNTLQFSCFFGGDLQTCYLKHVLGVNSHVLSGGFVNPLCFLVLMLGEFLSFFGFCIKRMQAVWKFYVKKSCRVLYNFCFFLCS